MTTRRQWIAAVGAGLACHPLWAQGSWPTRPLRIVHGGTPGGGSEIMVRAMEVRLRERLGQPLVVESRPGAGGMVGAQVVANAAPDGTNFYVSNVASHVVSPLLYRKPLIDPRKDTPAVALIASMTNALAVRADSGLRSVADLVAALRARPDKAFFGSASTGTSSHLCGLLFGQRAGVAVSHVPYKGTAANLNALLAGEVLFGIDNLPLYQPHVKAGTLRLLAVTQGRRSIFQPDVPTMQESGLQDFDIVSWYGMSAANGTPAAIVQRFGAEIVSALGDASVVERLHLAGAEPTPLGPQAYADFIEAELRKWAPLVKLSGAVVD